MNQEDSDSMVKEGRQRPVFSAKFIPGIETRTRDPIEIGPNVEGIAQRPCNLVLGQSSERLSRQAGFFNRYLSVLGDEIEVTETIPTAASFSISASALDNQLQADLPFVVVGWLADAPPGADKVWQLYKQELDFAVNQLSDMENVRYIQPVEHGELIYTDKIRKREILSRLNASIFEFYDHRYRFDTYDIRAMVLNFEGKCTTYGPELQFKTGASASKIKMELRPPEIERRDIWKREAANLEYKLACVLTWLLEDVPDYAPGGDLITNSSYWTRDSIAVMTSFLRLSSDEMIAELPFRILNSLDVFVGERFYSKLEIATMIIQELFKTYASVRELVRPHTFYMDVKRDDIHLLMDKPYMDYFFNAPIHHPHSGTKSVNWVPIGQRDLSTFPSFAFISLRNKGKSAGKIYPEYEEIAPIVGAPTTTRGNTLIVPYDDSTRPDYYPVSGEFMSQEIEFLRKRRSTLQRSMEVISLDMRSPFPRYLPTVDGFIHALGAGNTSILSGPKQFETMSWTWNESEGAWR